MIENLQDNEKTPLADHRKPGAVALGAVLSENKPIGQSTEAINFDQIQLMPASAKPYLDDAKFGLRLNKEGANETAIQYLKSLFPENDFEFVDEGANGIVFTDGLGKAYKIYKTAHNYSRVEQEAGSLQLLSQAGLAPKLHMLIDADPSYRLDRKAYDYTYFGFGDVVIPRIATSKELPVLVMDFIDTAPLESATNENFVDGFCNMLEVFLKNNIHCWDAEFKVNKATGQIIAIDTGEFYQKTISPSGEKDQLIEIIQKACMYFDITNHTRMITEAYKDGGVEMVRQYLASIKH